MQTKPLLFRALSSAFLSMTLSVAAVAAPAGGGTAAASDNEPVIPGEYLVKYRSSEAASLDALTSIGALSLIDRNPQGQLLHIKVQPGQDAPALAKLLADPRIEYVVPNTRLHAYRAPIEATVAGLKQQWAIEKVRAEAAWKRAGNRGSRKITLAIIDTGADYNHESLQPNMVTGYDFLAENTDPMDRTSARNKGHGTHCAGIAGATGVVEGGTVGISPELSIMPLRFLDENGSGGLSLAVRAIDYAIEHKVDVISASWGGSIRRQSAQPMIEAINRADAAGIIFVTAAGNDGHDNDTSDTFPANAGTPNMITVGATNSSDDKPSWSNYGVRNVDVAAPGASILSSLPGNKYGELSGTSMATPLVAGLVSFLKAQDPSLTGREIRALLQHTGARASIEVACHCRIDALDATGALVDHRMFLVPAVASVKIGDTVPFATHAAHGTVAYSVADSTVGTITPAGVFTAVGAGQTQVTATGTDGSKATTLSVTVRAGQSPEGPGRGGSHGCGVGHPLCSIICAINPRLSFCPRGAATNFAWE